VGGVEYPRTWAEFHAWFGNDDACLRFLEGLRWPEGFVCPHCDGRVGWRSARRRFTCGDCGVQTSVTAGTIFHGTRTPLVSWFAAMWYLTNQKNGVSALGLARVLGTDYKTAWTWLHKLRRAMVRPDRDLLDGPVEVDETYVGGPEQGLHGRQTITKSIVAIAIETRGKGFGRVRLHQVPDLSAESLVGFVTVVVAPGGIVRTDAWQGYRSLERAGYHHERTSLRRGRSRPRRHARRAPGGVTVETLAAGHPPRLGVDRAPRLLPRRIHVPVQPAQLTSSRAAVLPAGPTSRPNRPPPLQRRRWRQTPRLIPITGANAIPPFGHYAGQP
jgi:transposase-like protein